MRVTFVLAGLAMALAGGGAMADELTTARAEELLQPYMSNDCGSYYTTQGEPDFADLEDKQMCVYQPRVTRIRVSGSTASVDYNKDRHFTEEMSQAWLKDYAKMEAHQTPSLLFKTLKTHLEKWRADSGGVDHADRFATASFKLENGAWKVDAAPQ
ncbi:MAG TPA: hypothetical protein VFA75_08615 [Nevskia sp.]|nr:hypothetical protein [Nevskia sp.]